MWHLMEPAIQEAVNSSAGPRRLPAVPVAVAVAAGVFLDHAIAIHRFAQLSLGMWLLTAAAFLVSSLLLEWIREKRGIAGQAFPTGLLLLAVTAVSAASHHRVWSMTLANDVLTLASEESRLMRVTGRILEPPRQQVRFSDRLPDDAEIDDKLIRTVIVLQAEAVETTSQSSMRLQSHRVTGKVQLVVRGNVPSLEVGDFLTVTGWMGQPWRPQNPGEFNFRAYLASQGIRAILRVERGESLSIQRGSISISEWVSRVRARCRQQLAGNLQRHMHPERANVAEALLLGTRTQMSDELRRAFLVSGTLHILAISGMNVGVLWTWLWFLLRSLRCSSWWSSALSLIGLIGYAWLVDLSPPVIRATAIGVLAGFGWLLGRSLSVANLVAASVIIVLWLNPTDLFNLGAQLSFISFVAIAWTARRLRKPAGAIATPEDVAKLGPDSNAASAFPPGLFAPAKLLWETIVVTAVVWLTTTPLMAATSHLVSPAGGLLNIVLGPLTLLTMWLGYSFLLLGSLSEWLAVPLGWCFDQSLAMLIACVRWGAALDFGHVYFIGPPTWWLAGFYAWLGSLGLFAWGTWKELVWRRVGLAWVIAGLLISVVQSQLSTREFRCQFLSVGHGAAVLIECPNGRTILYDAGSLGNGQRAARIIAGALWSRGKTHLDVVLVSHADADHCNAIPELLAEVPVHQLCVARSFLDWKQPIVATVLDSAAKNGANIRLVRAGQQLLADPEVKLSILHPHEGDRLGNDNAHSLVLECEYRERRILLTGDLEGAGLQQFLQRPARRIDVLLAPHHGGKKSNSVELGRWANPTHVVSSQRKQGNPEILTMAYGRDVAISRTCDTGAITCVVSQSGVLRVAPFHAR